MNFGAAGADADAGGSLGSVGAGADERQGVGESDGVALAGEEAC